MAFDVVHFQERKPQAPSLPNRDYNLIITVFHQIISKQDFFCFGSQIMRDQVQPDTRTRTVNQTMRATESEYCPIKLDV